MAKATAKQSISVARTLGLQSGPIMAGAEAAAQTWKKGAPLKSASGLLTIIAESDVVQVVGIAAAPASGVTGKEVLLYPILPGMVFQAELSDLTDGLYTSLITDVWADFGINVTGDGKWFVDADEAGAEQAVTVIGFKDPVGTNNSICYFIFKSPLTIIA